MGGLAELVAPGLSVARTGLRQQVVLAGGAQVATLTVTRSPLMQVGARAFRQRLVRLNVDGAELETVWRLEVKGRHLADAVHLFPYNLFTPQGFRRGRGFELRDPKGTVIGYTDERRAHRETTLLYRDGRGTLRARCTARSFRRHLVFAGADGKACFDLVRERMPMGWQAPWMREALPEDLREGLGGCLALALLWVGP